jgi:5-methylthioribose kinase
MEEAQLIEHLVDNGLLNSSQVNVKPLNGGVSCEILLMDDGKNRFVVKRALEKLKVKDDWFADVGRNTTEQHYLAYVAKFLPNAVPQMLYSDTNHHFFCMEMLENGLENWKTQLLESKFNTAYAKKASEVLGTIHFKSAGDSEADKLFDTLNDFQQLRIEPYLLKTAERHPELQTYFYEEAKRLAAKKVCLVHGDYSPKNILVSPDRLVVLDCEVAWYGDPVFDVAFLLNHLVLKALYLPENSLKLMDMAEKTWLNYKKHAKTVVHETFEKELIHLLKMLMLARVDGKSPVEYLNKTQQQIVRDFVYQELPKSSINFEEFKNKWLNIIQE